MAQETISSEEFQEFVKQMSEAIETLAEVVRCFAEIVAERFLPAIRVIVEYLRRYGFFTQLYHRWVHRRRPAWWIAWHSPSWLIWKLPLSWVLWRV